MIQQIIFSKSNINDMNKSEIEFLLVYIKLKLNDDVILGSSKILYWVISC